MTDADFVDQPGELRSAEAFDASVLEAYLREHLQDFDGPLCVKQFRKGHSNLTYMVSDGRREWVLRRAPFGTKVKSAHDMGREYRILGRLHRAYPKAPRAVLYCDDESIIGAPFYVMERLVGVILRQSPPKGLVYDAETAQNLCQAFVENLAEIHATDLSVAGLADFGKPDGYIDRQVSGWTRRYHGSRTDDIPEIDTIAAWLAEKQPSENEGVLIHNDYKFDNLVLDPKDLTHIIGVLDWEMATIGHPLMDLGTSMSYWVQADDPPQLQVFRFAPTHVPGTFTRDEIVQAYGEFTGRDVSMFDFYYTYGLFKTAVVAQQIYYRFHQGKTQDRRFGMMIHGVRILAQQAAAVIESTSL